jgi:UDP-N-acetylglucosamine transferase subunit ALG13
MIFVTVGTNEAPFDRLLESIDRLQCDEELVVQHGASLVRPRGAVCIDFLPFDELVDRVRSARVVVTHAGVGSVLVALANGKHPLVVPRLREFGEAVDDHQLAFARRLERAGLVSATDPDALETALRTVPRESPPLAPESNGLAEELRGYLDGQISERSTKALTR